MNKHEKKEIEQIAHRVFTKQFDQYIHPSVDLHLLPRGTMPARKSKEAIGYDVHVRAIVCPFEMEKKHPHLRKTLFDFHQHIERSIKMLVEQRICEPEWRRKRPAYRLEPGSMALCGIGFVTAMPFPLCYLTLCRSGIASKHKIIVANGPGTVDPDYRGEAGIILFNCGKVPFYVYHGMRIAQIRFDYAIIPRLKRVARYGDLSVTDRAHHGFGSTGFYP